VSSRLTGLARGEIGVLENPEVDRRNASLTKRRHDELGGHGVLPNSHELVDEVALRGIRAGEIYNSFTLVGPRNLGGLETSNIQWLCLMCGMEAGGFGCCGQRQG
jgi:hypothetical protein